MFALIAQESKDQHRLLLGAERGVLQGGDLFELLEESFDIIAVGAALNKPEFELAVVPSPEQRLEVGIALHLVLL